MAGLDRVVIVGAGIGGLTMAVALRQAGIEAAVYERQPVPSRLLAGGGFMLWHNAVLALRQIKLDQAVVEAGVQIDRHEFRSQRDRVLATWQVGAAAEEIGAPALALRRSALNTVLTEAAGDCVRLGVRCVGVEPAGDRVRVRFDDGTADVADLVVGADGLRSAVRDALHRGYDPPPRYARYTAWQAIARIRGEEVAPTGTFVNLWGRAGLRFLYCRLNPDEVYWDAITSDRAGAAFDTVRSTRRDNLLRGYAEWPEAVRTVIRSTAEDAILPVDIFDRPPARFGAWSAGRVVLIGDAAHPMTLNLSQGAGQAIEDAVVLSGLLTGPADVPTALRRYEAIRRDRVAEMVDTSYRIGELGRWHNRLRCGGRELFMRAFFGTVGRRGSYRLMMDVSF